MSSDERRRPPLLLPAFLSALFAYLVFDFLAHAVLLASWWRATAEFWFPPETLFRMIPFAYLSFALYVAALMWLMTRVLDPRPPLVRSLGFGATAGAAFGLTAVLGTYSVLPMPSTALIVWPASFAIESTAAAGAVSLVIGAGRPWTRALFVLLAVVVLFIVGVVLQNLFFATPAL